MELPKWVPLQHWWVRTVTVMPTRIVAALKPVLAVRTTFWLPDSSVHFLELGSPDLKVICFFGDLEDADDATALEKCRHLYATGSKWTR
jgi:hypothetical protein